MTFPHGKVSSWASACTHSLVCGVARARPNTVNVWGVSVRACTYGTLVYISRLVPAFGGVMGSLHPRLAWHARVSGLLHGTLTVGVPVCARHICQANHEAVRRAQLIGGCRWANGKGLVRLGVCGDGTTLPRAAVCCAWSCVVKASGCTGGLRHPAIRSGMPFSRRIAYAFWSWPHAMRQFH